MSQTKRWMESIGYFDEDGNVKDDQLIADYITCGINPDQIGYISANRWQEMSEKLAQYGIIDRVPSLTDSLDSSLWLVA